MWSLCFSFQSVWVRKGTLRWWRDWKPQRWVDVGVALEQSTKSDGRKDSIFFVYYTQYDEKKVGFAVTFRFVGKITSAATYISVTSQLSLCLVSVSSCVHKWGDRTGSSAQGLQLCLCRVHSPKDQTEVASGPGSTKRNGHEWLGNSYTVTLIKKQSKKLIKTKVESVV